MRIVYRDGWDETFILSSRVFFRCPEAPEMAIILAAGGDALAWRKADTIREVYSL